MDREQVRQALEVVQAEFGITDLDHFIRSAWEDGDIVNAEGVAELVERATEIALDQHFLWVHIVEFEDTELRIPDGWYSFVAVHPETGQCLTFINDQVYRWKCAGFRARIRSADDAIDAVTRLTELIEQNLMSRAVK